VALNKKKKVGNYILILENDRRYSRVCELKLKIEGFAVKVVANVSDFFVELKRGLPDLILLDLMLEESTGFEVLEKIKKDAHLKKLKVVVYSGLGQDEDREKALKLGAVEYLNKSEITLQQLVQEVKRQLGS
jgi:DNA-binding response OmpR family regulator